jgi:hypothetical protein
VVRVLYIYIYIYIYIYDISRLRVNIKFSTYVCGLESSGTIAGVLNSVMQWLPFSSGSTATHEMQLRTFVVTVVVALTLTYCFILRIIIQICRSVMSTNTAQIVTILPPQCTTSNHRTGFNDHYSTC